VPAIVGRFAEQTTKGFMWRSIGLAPWLFDFDVEDDIARFAATVLAMARDGLAARSKVVLARTFVRSREAAGMAVVARSLPG
jgi:hypothetical protein